LVPRIVEYAIYGLSSSGTSYWRADEQTMLDGEGAKNEDAHHLSVEIDVAK
jgi:hypothetical protein